MLNINKSILFIIDTKTIIHISDASVAGNKIKEHELKNNEMFVKKFLTSS